jgi:hypothetical protein
MLRLLRFLSYAHDVLCIILEAVTPVLQPMRLMTRPSTTSPLHQIEEIGPIGENRAGSGSHPDALSA